MSAELGGSRAKPGLRNLILVTPESSCVPEQPGGEAEEADHDYDEHGVGECILQEYEEGHSQGDQDRQENGLRPGAFVHGVSYGYEQQELRGIHREIAKPPRRQKDLARGLRVITMGEGICSWHGPWGIRKKPGRRAALILTLTDQGGRS